jgi:hypothetical protein
MHERERERERICGLEIAGRQELQLRMQTDREAEKLRRELARADELREHQRRATEREAVARERRLAMRGATSSMRADNGGHHLEDVGCSHVVNDDRRAAGRWSDSSPDHSGSPLLDMVRRGDGVGAVWTFETRAREFDAEVDAEVEVAAAWASVENIGTPCICERSERILHWLKVWS